MKQSRRPLRAKQKKKSASATKMQKVKSVTPKGVMKNLTLADAIKATRPLQMHRFAMVGPQDRLIMGNGIERRVWVNAENGSEPIPLVPLFELSGQRSLAGENVRTRIAELSTESEMQDYLNLEAFHYRGIDFTNAGGEGNGSKKGTGGRRAVLLLQLHLQSKWITAGYLELHMPLMMAKPRHDAFDRPYHHPKLKVRWDRWKKGGQGLVNRIARIARVVVHPEFRGAGLANLLVDAAVTFARDRWHIGGRRALFLEISAEMLRHIDFVSGSGFHYLGDTEGNRTRLAKDLRSIKRGASGASGIMSLQRRYYSLFENYRKDTGETFEALRSRLANLLGSDDPWKAMTIDEWLALRPVIRSPIPYFMIGLDDYSEKYLQPVARISPTQPEQKFKPKVSELKLEKLVINSNYPIPVTPHNRLIMDCFGITARVLNTRLAGPISLSAMAGTVTFIAGSSGAGKSVLLSQLDPSWSPKTISTSGKISPSRYSVGWLRPLPSGVPLFQVLADLYGAEVAFDALARVGLSEAMLFLKPFEMLSRGQRYRAMLADLTLRDDNVWLIDEFCSDLDPLAARLVAHRLRETVRKQKRIAFVAAANHQHFIKALKPAQIVNVSTGGACQILQWGAYSDGILF